MLNINFSNSLMTLGIFLDGSEISLRNALNLIDQFSGLKPNYDKTKCIWIGSNRRIYVNAL